MDSNATACVSTEDKSISSVDASIVSTVDMLQSFTIGDSGDDVLQPEPAQDVDMDVDTPTNENPQTNEMSITSSEGEHVRFKSTSKPRLHQHGPAGTTACPNANPLEREAMRSSEGAPKPQHKHLKHLVGVDAKSKAPAAFSLDRVVAGSVQRGGAHPLQRPSCAKAKQSRLAQAAKEALDQEA